MARDHRHQASSVGGVRPATAKAILDATREILAVSGVRGLTIEGVSSKSGVAKTTIYRGWGSKEELALAVLIEMVDEPAASVPAGGDARAELLTFVRTAVRILASTLMGRVMQGLVSDLAADPQLALAFRERVVARRSEDLVRLLQRGIDHGDLPAHAEIGLANELLFGPVYYRLLFSGKAIDDEFAERVVDAFLTSIAGGPASVATAPESAGRKTAAGSGRRPHVGRRS